ncbi:hypothetical protein Tco_1019351, partial [Tanacetum coccineum]
NLKTQLKGKMPCVTIDVKTPKVSAFENLKDTLDTLRKIVEEARSELPSDSNLDYACVYTKRFQELLAYASASCPKATCNECINSDSHDKCVDKSLKFSKPTPVRKIWRVKQVKQTWQPTGKLFTTVGHHWKPIGRTFPLGAQCPLTRKTTPKVVPVKIWKPTGRIIPLRGQSPLTRPTVLTSDVVLVDPQSSHLVTMAYANINAPEVPTAAASPLTRSDEQILPRNKWVPVGKSNCFLDVERSQANPIFKIVVDILKNTNFFKAFTASSTIPSIYIQQFWDTIRFDKDKGYNCQLDEQRFYLSKATLRDALQLPQDNNNFTSPPNANTIISFVNELGYPNVVRTLSGFVTNDMYQPWRALTMIINLCLTGKTLAFERLRAPVLQILGQNESGSSYGGKEESSPLHLPTEESALGYLKFTFKNTKRVRFGMAIPDTLISEEIRSAPYYPEYVAKVTKYQRYLAGEVVSDDDAPAPKPTKGATTKTTTKPKPQSSKTAPIAKPTASKTSKSTSSQPSKPTPAPAKPQEKKRKLVVDTTEAPPQANRAKAGKVLKKRTLPSTRQLVDEFVNEGVPNKEPMYSDEEADTEPDTRKFQPLPEVPGKGKEKVGEEQAAQRRTPAPTIPSSHEESSSLYAELGLTDSETDSDNEVSRDINPKAHIEGQAGSDPGKQVEAQAGSDPGVDSDS